MWRSRARWAEALGRERDDVARRVWRSADGRFDTPMLVTTHLEIPDHRDAEEIVLTRAELAA